MSFVSDLLNRSRKGTIATPTARSIPMSLPEAQEGLAGTFREPYRVNAPLNNNFTPANRQTTEQQFTPNRYRRI